MIIYSINHYANVTLQGSGGRSVDRRTVNRGVLSPYRRYEI